MRVSMWSSYLFDYTPEDMVRTFAAHGWEYLEFSDEHAKVLLERGRPEDVGYEFRRFAESEGISFPQGHLWLDVDFAMPEEADRRAALDTLKNWCDMFAALGVKAGVLHVGGRAAENAKVDPALIREWQVSGLSELAAHTDGTPLTICLENIPTFNAREIDELLALADDAAPGAFGICLDTGHLNIWSESRDCPAFIRKAGDRLKALHIADNLGQNDDHMLPFGRGTVDWESTLAALKEINCQAVFNFEVPGERHCPQDILLAKLDYALKLGKLMVG